MTTVLDVGRVPAADHFPEAAQPMSATELAHPLSMAMCTHCDLAQLVDDDTVTDEPRGVEPQALRDQAESAILDVAADGFLAGRTVREFGSPHGGTWLPLFTSRGFVNVASTPRGKALSDVDAPADVVLDSLGMMHEPDQAAAMTRRAATTSASGVLLVQFHSLGAIVTHGQWNALRHGHFAYYSIASMCALLRGSGLSAVTGWRYDLYGGTVLIAARHGDHPSDERLETLRTQEKEQGVTDPYVVRSLQTALDRQVHDLRAWLVDAAAAGRRVYAYGAASRAVALFARAHLTGALLAGVADASAAKHGRRMPGTDVPIVAPDVVVTAAPDAVFLTVPDLEEEVARAYPELAPRLLTEPPAPVTSSASEPVSTTSTFGESNRLQARLHQMVPGGAHTYARGSDQYPEQMAPILVRGSGARVWDADGNEFVEYGIGLRSVTLGHAYRPVIDAVTTAIADGVNFSRPTALETHAAQDFLTLVPTAEMVKFAKNGSDATTAAVRLARAATGRELVGVCDHPFFSVDDWFIGRTAMNAGIPAHTIASSIGFAYNDADSVTRMFEAHGKDLACVVLEAATATAEPAPGFLEQIRAQCDRHGVVLVFDEMITGFRWSEHGAQSLYGVVPDLSTWGKAMGNGFPIAALAGKRSLMELGGLATDADRVFLLSTTHGPETASLAAFRAVVAAYARDDPIGAMTRYGIALRDGVNRLAADAGVAEHVAAVGRPANLLFTTRDAAGTPSQAMRTLFLQELIAHGVLGQSFVPSAAHTDADLRRTLDAVAAALPTYRRAIDTGSVDGLLRGRPVAPALRARAHPRRL